MEGFEFLKAEYLWLIIPVFLLYIIYVLIKGTEKVEMAVFSIIAVLIIFTLAHPVIKKGYKTIYKKDTEIMIMLDHSLSMAVDDIKPYRFEVAREKVIKLIKKLYDEKIGLLLFSDRSDIVFMPYEKKEKILQYLRDLKIPLKGSTNLLDAFSSANSALTGKRRIVILVSDGGDEDISKIVQLVKGSQLTVVYYGIGTVKGGGIPGFNAVSKLNLSLEKVAEVSDGIMVKVSKDDRDIREITEFIKKISEKTKTELLKIPDYAELTPYIAFLILGLIMLNSALKRFLAGFMIFFFLTSPSYSGDIKGVFNYILGDYEKAAVEFLKEKDPVSQFNGAVSYIKAGMCDKALPVLKNIKTEDLELVKKIEYNISFCYILDGKYKKGREILDKLVQIYPEDQKIKKLYLFANMVVNLNKKPEKRKTVVEIKEDKPKRHEKSQMEVGDRNPW
ncbi:MAG TPA: VWA domain-containing protein [Persephonella sp.]|uniref:Putative von Willebrand factor, type A n=1 Tax=Persephonella marina (strain DSM 14350 / EX-H1) TaxID=123214 RepID=C0QP93_PERMH|nr:MULTISPECIES: vWA domain-containing protein [Persephonella]ACO03742.1 putative von Willebrand factor, type A [Persephonella marina EX-H1]HCB69896.1 VWA domain-containing protein [Persephonella sp.]